MDGRLLEDLASKMGVFISNLGSDYCVPLVESEFKKLKAGDYSLAAWSYCLEYIYHKSFQISSYNELDGFLSQLSNEPK